MSHVQEMAARFSVAACLILVMTGCASLQASLAPAEIDAGVRAARQQWNSALLGRDSAALARLVEDSAVHVTVRFTHVGRPAFLAQFLSGMRTRPQFRLTYSSEQVNPCERPNCLMATEYGTWRETWLESGEPTEVSGTYYSIWRHHGNVWQIQSETFATTRCQGKRYCGGAF